MFDIAWSEFLIVGVVALVVVGPRDLPALLRQVGRMVATVRRMAGEFQGQFNEAMREAELDDLRRGVTDIKDAAKKAVGGDPFSIARDELKKAVDGKPADTPSALAGETPTAAPAVPDASPVPSAFAPPPPEPPAVSPEKFDRAIDAEPSPAPDDRAPMTEPKRRPKRVAPGPTP